MRQEMRGAFGRSTVTRPSPFHQRDQKRAAGVSRTGGDFVPGCWRSRRGTRRQTAVLPGAEAHASYLPSGEVAGVP